MRTYDRPHPQPLALHAYPVQPIEIARHLGFCLGNAVKYVLRAPFKGGIEDCNKALKYLEWESEIPGRDVPHWRAVLLRYVMDELHDHLRGAESTNPSDDDITDIQADFLLSLRDYLEDVDSSVAGMRERIHELAQALAGKAKGGTPTTQKGESHATSR